MKPVVDYFTALHASLGAGTPETSGYPALANLLNAVGETLKPKITAVIHPANNGAGIPDGGLFSTKELKKHGDDRNTLFGKLKPERGVTMPGPGKVTTGTRGDGFLDIHLNATTRWKDVPESVWSYTLGGYQVLKKWLSYREQALLGRPLTSVEAQQFTHHVRRIASILALNGELDSHYKRTV